MCVKSFNNFIMQVKKIYAVLILLSVSVFAFSQTKLTGKVLDTENSPIIGASIYIEGTSLGTISNIDGEFHIETKLKEGKLVVSFIGCTTVKLAFNGSQNFPIVLTEDLTSIEDVMVVGYGSSKKRDLTNAVSQVSNIGQISNRPVSNFNDFLQGNVAGVTVVQQGGDPTSTPEIIVRGVPSINSRDVLWVVDGMPYYGGTINPNDIESVTILKDASSQAIYGAQAAGGVILVTTKSGKAGKNTIEVDVYAGVQQALNLPTALTAEQQNWAYNTASDNSGSVYNPARNAELNPWGNVTRTNWIDEIFRNASVYSANMSLTGGTEKAKYSTSFNYLEKEGLLLGTSLNRLNSRIKTEFKLGDQITIGQNLYVTREEAIGTNTESSYSGTIINAIYMPSAAPVYDENGDFHGVAPQNSVYAGAYGDVYNPVSLLLRPTTTNPKTTINANIYGEYQILKDLKYRTSYSISQAISEYKKFTPEIPENGRPSEMNYLYQKWGKLNRWVWDNQVTYAKNFGDHAFDFTGVYSAQFAQYEANDVNAQKFAREEEWYQYLQNAGEITSYGSSVYEDALTSVIGRLRYNYAEKYYLSASIRKDRTSRFTQDNNSDIFPSLSAAWTLSNESFMSGIDALELLKIRASWGVIGDVSSAAHYAYNVPMSSQKPTMGEGDAKLVSGYYVNKQSNKKIKWETTESYNFGLDLSVFKGKLEFTTDYFQKYTHDMIMTNAADVHLGVSEGPDMNVGLVSNKGIEFQLTHKQSIGDFSYSVSANATSIKNELVDLNNYSSDYIYNGTNVRGTLYPYRSEPGQELYSFYLITSEGTFKSQEEINNHVGPEGQLIQPKAKPGDLKFKDENNDGVINDEDRIYKGNAFPDFSYGFNLSASYKGIELSAVIQGVAGAQLFNGYKYSTYNAALQGYNLDSRVLDAWSQTNANSDIPMLRTNDPNNNFGTNSDWYLESSNYLRLKNITLSYNLPASIMSKWGTNSSMRVFVSGENLLTLTKYSGLDPEVGGIGLDMANYPVARTFTAGLSMKF
jgi:TonB-dependent starch-binding outer membrane protein SusC